MKGDKVKTFMTLAGQEVPASFIEGDEEKRKLGAQLLLSEVLEYVIYGLGVSPEVNGIPIAKPDSLTYSIARPEPDRREMLDGLADVAYTMYWNMNAFGIPLEEGFEFVCDNNLEKFVPLEMWEGSLGPLPREEWHCQKDISWPPEVHAVEIVQVEGCCYAVGKDANGKVRKPSSYRPVDLSALI